MSAYNDSYKLFHDTFKHLSTLSTGAIVILTTFLTKYSEAAVRTDLLKWSIALLLFSTLGSVIVMVGFASACRPDHKPTEGENNVFVFGVLLAGLSFIGGLGTLAFFMFYNLDVKHAVAGV